MEVVGPLGTKTDTASTLTTLKSCHGSNELASNEVYSPYKRWPQGALADSRSRPGETASFTIPSLSPKGVGHVLPVWLPPHTLGNPHYLGGCDTARNRGSRQAKRSCRISPAVYPPCAGKP